MSFTTKQSRSKGKPKRANRATRPASRRATEANSPNPNGVDQTSPLRWVCILMFTVLVLNCILCALGVADPKALSQQLSAVVIYRCRGIDYLTHQGSSMNYEGKDRFISIQVGTPLARVEEILILATLELAHEERYGCSRPATRNQR
jgi:hypothetical protein